MPGTTPIYGLPYPQSTDLVADYPSLGQDLAMDLDGILNGKASTTDFPAGTWNSYTPTWTATGGTPAIGNGTLSGYWQKAGKITTAIIILAGGSTTTFTGSSYRLGLPVASNIPSGTGSALVYNANTGTSYVGAVYHDNATSFLVSTNSGFIGATSPGTWATNWILRITITYSGA